MSQTPEPTTPEVTSAPAIDEVVTQALLRIVDLPENSGRIALITLDNQRDHTKPNTFGVAGLASLDRALDGVDDHLGHRARVHEPRARLGPERRVHPARGH